MAISANQKPTIYRNLYENTAPASLMWDQHDSIMVVSCLAPLLDEIIKNLALGEKHADARDVNLDEMKWMGLWHCCAHRLKWARRTSWHCIKWHWPADTQFKIWTLALLGRARYLAVTYAPHNTRSSRRVEKLIFFCNSHTSAETTSHASVWRPFGVSTTPDSQLTWTNSNS